MNTEVSYLYRDGSNYKSSGEVVFTGTLPEDVRQRMMDEGEVFLAHSVRVPEVFLYQQGYRYDEDSDHCYHEIFGVENTDKEPDDEFNRTAEEFAKEFFAKKDEGVFDPRGRWPDMELYKPGSDGECLDVCITEGAPCSE